MVSRKFLGLLISCGFAFLAWRFASLFRGPSDLAASVQNSTAPQDRLISDDGSRAVEDQKSAFTPSDDDHPKDAQSYDELDLEQLITTADLWNQVSLTEVSRRLRKQDEGVVGRYFAEALERSTIDRSRLISIADAYQGAQLLTFWQKVIESKPTWEHDVFMNQDLYKATRALRLISASNPEAGDYLERMALDPLIHHNNLLLRKQAFLAVREIDLAASARILRMLPREDNLLRELGAL